MFAQIVVFSGLLAVVLGGFVPPAPVVPIVYSRSDIAPNGSFRWAYQSGDGSSQEQAGDPIPVEGGESVSGVAQWTDPQGGAHQVNYVADENGYQPSSADLPVGPEIPAAIIKSLQWNAAHPEEETA